MSFKKGMSGTEVSPRGPLTDTAVGEGARVMVGGMVMGCLPMFEIMPARAGADDEKERRAWRDPACHRESIAGDDAEAGSRLACQIRPARVTVTA